jgi:hypothetical protein
MHSENKNSINFFTMSPAPVIYIVYYSMYGHSKYDLKVIFLDRYDANLHN